MAYSIRERFSGIQTKVCCWISKYFQGHGVEHDFEAIGEDLPVRA